MNAELGVVMDMLMPALECGCTVTTCINASGNLSIDLNTHAKSSCVLVLEGSEIVAYRRYDRRDVVQSFDHIVDLVHGCGHGRSFFDDGWLKVFESRGLDDPRGVL